MTAEPASAELAPLRILIVSQYFWPEEPRINDLARGLVDRGHAVTVLTGIPNYPSGRIAPGYGQFGPWTETHDGIRILRAPLVPRGSRPSKLSFVLNYLSLAITGSIMAVIRCRKQFDVVFVYGVSPITIGFPAIIAKSLNRAPLFFWVLDLWPESLSASGVIKSPFADKVAGLIARTVYRSSDVVLATSKAYFGSIEATARFAPDMRYLPQWAEERAPDGEVTDSSVIPALPTGFRVLFTGSMGVSQDFETILAAAEHTRGHPQIKWIIVGDGHRLSWVREQITERGLSDTVFCLGRYPASTMPAFFAQADALLATLKDEHVFSLTVPAKIQSYLASGRPIVTAINGEVSRIITESRSGLAVPASDSTALGEAVLSLEAMSPEARREMGARARAFFESEYDRAKLFDQLVGWFREKRSSKSDA